MITLSYINQWRNGEAMTFFDNVDSILSAVDTDALQLRPFTDPLLAEYAEMKKLYKMERGSKITRELIEWDKQRDRFFVALRTILLQHAQAHPTPAERKKAESLYDIFTKFGEDLHRKSYQEQTAGMLSIIESTEADAEGLAGIVSLHLTVYYDAMKEANQRFDTAYLARNSEYATKPKDKLKAARGRAEEAFGILATKINAHIELAADPEPYKKVAGEIAALVDTYRQAMERRYNGSSDEADEGLDADFREIEEG